MWTTKLQRSTRPTRNGKDIVHDGRDDVVRTTERQRQRQTVRYSIASMEKLHVFRNENVCVWVLHLCNDINIDVGDDDKRAKCPFVVVLWSFGERMYRTCRSAGRALKHIVRPKRLAIIQINIMSIVVPPLSLYLSFCSSALFQLSVRWENVFELHMICLLIGTARFANFFIFEKSGISASSPFGWVSSTFTSKSMAVFYLLCAWLSIGVKGHCHEQMDNHMVRFHQAANIIKPWLAYCGCHRQDNGIWWWWFDLMINTSHTVRSATYKFHALRLRHPRIIVNHIVNYRIPQTKGNGCKCSNPG